MPLPLQRLDDRTFDQLVSEGQVLLPRAAPAWTDHNVHDPGITLLELFAWLAEMDFYRLDRTTEASYRSFLRLVGIEPRPPQVAETVVVVERPATSVHLPAGTRVASLDGKLVFASTWIRVSTAKLEAVFGGAADALTDRSRANDLHGQAYVPLGVWPHAGDALYLGFDQVLADEPAPVSMYVWTAAEVADRETRARLQAEMTAAREEALKYCPPDFDTEVFDWRRHYSARTVWEFHTGQGAWAPLEDVVDETRALTLSGAVRFAAPPLERHAPGGVDVPGQDGRFFIRCRLAAGRYDCPPALLHVALNAAPARHVDDVATPKPLGSSDGSAHQVFRLPASPVVPASTRVDVTVNGSNEGSWKEALVWDRVGPRDRVYVLTPETGELAFGDGRHGRIPPAGARISARYQIGGGPTGNVAAGTLVRVMPPHASVQVTQPFAAIGGAAGEGLSDAIGRALEALAARRAVTLEDFEQLALRVPGAAVARARAIADYHPAAPCLPALGCITLVIVPPCGTPPLPSAELLREVRRHLERRRMLTTELHVVAPEYTVVSVRARLHYSSDIGTDKIVEEAKAALNALLDPLKGGPTGNGWPVGRDLYRAEVMARLSRLPGVTYVDAVGLRSGDGPFAACGNVAVCRHGLVSPGLHEITVQRSDR